MGKSKGMGSDIFLFVIGISIIFFIGGCAGLASKETKARFKRTIPVCTSKADCKAKWEAAQLWVVHNADFKIRTVTNVLIETESSGRSGSTALGARVTKEPLGDGNYKLVVQTWCNNPFGCSQDPWEAALDFNRTVKAAAP